VKLINTDGMAFIGPGSEWFWTALSGLVLAVTFVAIYRQLRLQASANALERFHALENRWESRRMMLAGLEAALALRRGTPERGMNQSMVAIAEFFADLCELLDRGHIGFDEVYEFWGANVLVWWSLLERAATEQRVLDGDPKLFGSFERLNSLVHGRNVKDGRPDDLPPLSRSELIDESIRRRREILLLQRAAESGVIPGEEESDQIIRGEPSTALA
jgi:hypothetical protein